MERSDEATFMKWVQEEVIAKAGDGTGRGVPDGGFQFADVSRRLQKELPRSMPNAMWVTYEPLGGQRRARRRTAAFGAGLRPVPQIDKADVILALDSDFLGSDEGSVATTRAFSARRKPEQKMNRLYVVENRYTTTGGMADHRLRVPGQPGGGGARELAERSRGGTGDAGLERRVGKVPGGRSCTAAAEAEWVDGVAKDLVANGARRSCWWAIASRRRCRRWAMRSMRRSAPLARRWKGARSQI